MLMPGCVNRSQLARGEVEPEHRGMPEVADKQRAVAVEGEAEGEAAGRRHFLDRRSVRRDPEDLAVLAAAPHPAVGADSDAFRMLQPRLGEHAVEQHPRTIERQHGIVGGRETEFGHRAASGSR